MKTKSALEKWEMQFALLITLLCFCNILVFAQQNEGLKDRSPENEENVVSKINYEVDGLNNSIIINNRKNLSEDREYNPEGNPKETWTISSDCDSTWQGGTDPSFSFYLFGDTLIKVFKVIYSVSSGGCSETTTTTFSSKKIIDHKISFYTTNTYYNGFKWVTNITDIDGTFSEDMNSISGTYAITAGTCEVSIAGAWTATPATPRPAQPSLISGKTTVCSGVAESYVVNDEAGISFDWSASGGTVTGSGNAVIITWNLTGTQTLTITPSNECGNGKSITLDVTVLAAPSQPSLISGKTSVCSGVAESYSITNELGVTYDWLASGGTVSGSGDAVIVTWNTTGNQTLTVTPSNECGISIGRTLGVAVNTVPSQPSNITGNATAIKGIAETYSVTNVPGLTYTWSASAGTVTGSGNSVSVIWTSTGVQTLTVTPSNDCGYGMGATIAVTVNEQTGMEEIADNADFFVYPVPVKGIITIENEMPDSYVTVFSIEGKAIIRKTLSEKVSRIDLSNLSKGIYFIRLENSKTAKIKKVIIQ